MLAFLAKRLLLILPTALGVAVLTFLLMHLTPGDPVEALLGEYALPADRAALEQAMGLNLPLFDQFINFMKGIAVGDLGNSFYSHKPVAAEIIKRLPATAYLAFWAMLFALIISIPLGVISAAKQRQWPDKLALLYAMLGFSMPSFWLGPLLIILFSIVLGLTPVSGDEHWNSVILPAITLGMAMSAFTTRLVRNAVLETLQSDYIKTAKAKGTKPHKVLFKHALKNALLPVITVVFLQAGALLTGAILTESIFSWPGVGSLIVESLHKRDYPMVQGCVLFIAAVYMLMTLLSDIVYALADPRVRYGKQKGKA